MVFPFTRGQKTCYCPHKMLLPRRQITDIVPRGRYHKDNMKRPCINLLLSEVRIPLTVLTPNIDGNFSCASPKQGAKLCFVRAVFSGVRVARSLVFSVMFCRSFFVLLVIIISILLRIPASGCPFRIFKLSLCFFCAQ
jgi:hypothetical protein